MRINVDGSFAEVEADVVLGDKALSLDDFIMM
jgi:hypothetical protein